MGMWDDITCDFPLPVEGNFHGRIFNTKDTPAQKMADYQIRRDGSLYKKVWSRTVFNADNSSHTFETWKPVEFTGDINFYDWYENSAEGVGWIEFSATFVNGKTDKINLIEERIL